MRSAFKGTKLSNETAVWLDEYSTRRRMAKLGYMTNFADLDVEKAEAFCFIDAEIERLEMEEAKKSKRTKRG